MHLELAILLEVGLPEAVELLNRGFADYFMPIRADVSGFLRMASQDGVDLSLSRVVLLDGEGVGLSLIARRGWTSRLAGMAIVPEARGQGIGRWLMERLIEEARQRGERRMVLEVIEQNEPAVRLYRSCGFRVRRRLLSYTTVSPAGLPPEDLPALVPMDIRELARWVTTYGLPELPWQVSGETLALAGPPSQAGRQQEAAVLISNPAREQIGIRSLLVRPAARRQGQATRLLHNMLARYPGRTWQVPALCPEEIGGVFEKAGFTRGDVSQLQMALVWEEA